MLRLGEGTFVLWVLVALQNPISHSLALGPRVRPVYRRRTALRCCRQCRGCLERILRRHPSVLLRHVVSGFAARNPGQAALKLATHSTFYLPLLPHLIETTEAFGRYS